jgi:serine/threonine protein kinase
MSEGRFLPGRLLAGRYRIIALLGKGGMGEVYRADDLTLGQPVALKFLPDEAARDEGLLERFKNEVRIARRVSHPNVCRVYDVGDVEGTSSSPSSMSMGKTSPLCCGASVVCPRTRLSTLHASSAQDWPPLTPREFFIAT